MARYSLVFLSSDNPSVTAEPWCHAMIVTYGLMSLATSGSLFAMRKWPGFLIDGAKKSRHRSCVSWIKVVGTVLVELSRWNCAGGTILVELNCWKGAVGTLLLELCWLNCFVGTVFAEWCWQMVLVEQCWSKGPTTTRLRSTDTCPARPMYPTF